MDVLAGLQRKPLREVACFVSRRSRAKKLDMFKSYIRPGSTLLLVGVSTTEGIGTDSAVEKGLLGHAEVTLLVYEGFDGPLWGRPTYEGDARNLPFGDKSFDYVCSNAVIEHVGGPEGVAAMIRESARVARRGWLHTTPNRWFPIEPHLMVPVVHWLPEHARQRVFAALGFDAYTREHYWPLSSSQLRRLGAEVSRCTGRWPAMTLAAHAGSLQG